MYWRRGKEKSSFSCQCEGQKATSLQQHHETREINKIRYIVIGIVALAVWWVVYSGIVPLSQWIAYDLFPLEKGSPLGDSVEFFFMTRQRFSFCLSLWFTPSLGCGLGCMLSEYEIT